MYTRSQHFLVTSIKTCKLYSHSFHSESFCSPQGSGLEPRTRGGTLNSPAYRSIEIFSNEETRRATWFRLIFQHACKEVFGNSGNTSLTGQHLRFHYPEPPSPLRFTYMKFLSLFQFLLVFSFPKSKSLQLCSDKPNSNTFESVLRRPNHYILWLTQITITFFVKIKIPV